MTAIGVLACGNDFDQLHVARRIEEVDAAETLERSASGMASDSEVIDSPEVLEAKMAFGPTCGATFS